MTLSLNSYKKNFIYAILTTAFLINFPCTCQAFTLVGTEHSESLENTESEEINWQGMNCVMFGDSITWYDGNRALGGNHDIQKGFPSYLNESFGIVSDNLAESGACLVSHPETDYIDIYDKIMETDTSVYDIVVIDGGATDYKYHPCQIGEVTECEDSEYDISTFCGAYQTLIEKILTENSNVILILFTPIPERNDIEPNELGFTKRDYVDAVFTLGNHYDIPVLNLYDLESFNASNLEELTLDGVHPNNAGYQAICQEALIPFFEKLGRNIIQQ